MVCVRVCVFEHVLPWPQIFPCALSGPKSVQVNHNACTRRETRALIHAFGSFMHMIKGAHAGSVSAGTQARTDTYACALLDDHKHTEKHTQARTHACMHVTADGRWMEPAAAVAWIQSKLRAAEALWEQTQPPHVDYALVMDGDEDEAFFMTDYAQE